MVLEPSKIHLVAFAIPTEYLFADRFVTEDTIVQSGRPLAAQRVTLGIQWGAIDSKGGSYVGTTSVVSVIRAKDGWWSIDPRIGSIDMLALEYSQDN